MTHPDAGNTSADGSDDDSRTGPVVAAEPDSGRVAAHEQDDELVDEMVDESFPGSDPPSTWAGSDTSPG